MRVGWFKRKMSIAKERIQSVIHSGFALVRQLNAYAHWFKIRTRNDTHNRAPRIQFHANSKLVEAHRAAKMHLDAQSIKHGRFDNQCLRCLRRVRSVCNIHMICPVPGHERIA